MSDEQTLTVETQPAPDTDRSGGGDDPDCCRAPGDSDGGPDT